MITTHVLDTTSGRPARGVPVALEQLETDGRWRVLSRKKTDANGRISDLVSSGVRIKGGIYRMTFETAAYFHSIRTPAFYPWVSVAFEIKRPRDHHHVPLLLSPYGYSTYRGS